MSCLPRLLEKRIIEFCNVISSVFDLNKEKGVPNFVYYCASTSKMPNSNGHMEVYSIIYRVDTNFPEELYQYLIDKYDIYINELKNKRQKELNKSLKDFFNKANDEKNKKKFLIKFSSLMLLYMDVNKKSFLMNLAKHKCDDLFLKTYIFRLTSELLLPIQLNLEGTEYTKIELMPTTKYNKIINKNKHLSSRPPSSTHSYLRQALLDN